jgi:DNA-binding transcriptional ArsR family regulator
MSCAHTGPVPEVVHGIADISAVAALMADPTRARILTALTDGRALPASVLASEAGVTASTTSEHLARLLEGGLVDVERSGRHRYYELANDQVAAAIESLAALAPQLPVTSLRASTRAASMRRARTCYDHLAGRLGVAVTEALVRRRALIRTDGVSGTERSPDDPLASTMPVHPYRLGAEADGIFSRLGVDVAALPGGDSRRPLLRFCVDWSEQRHHLAGALGAGLLDRMLAAEWVRRSASSRSVELTPEGRQALADVLGVDCA